MTISSDPAASSDSPMEASRLRMLTGWGQTSPTVASVLDATAARDVLAAAGRGSDLEGRGVLARGLGRGYGDVAQNGGGAVLAMGRNARIRSLDLPGATVDVDAGVSLDHLLRVLLPLGLSLPVQPGTRQVSVGGAIACDIHGKNHHRVGSFGDTVVSLVLLTPDGDSRHLAAEGPDEDLFWATVGGLGLTGVVTSARLRLRRVETSYVAVEAERCADLSGLMDVLGQRDHSSEYSVAWFDSITTGRGAGRGIVLSGRDAVVDDLDPSSSMPPLHVPAARKVRVPALPVSVVNRASGRVFNEAWFRRVPRTPRRSVEHSFGFFQPLDGLVDWYRLYGPRGLVQYQLVVPNAAAAVVHDVVREVAASGHASCLNVLKRFGAGSRGMMSFPMPGWTLAVDLPARSDLGRLLDRLDAMVLEAGGRVYLAKDSRLAARDLDAMYPRADEFAGICRRVDPGGVMQSDLGRRLRLTRRGVDL